MLIVPLTPTLQDVYGSVVQIHIIVGMVQLFPPKPLLLSVQPLNKVDMKDQPLKVMVVLGLNIMEVGPTYHPHQQT